MVLSMRGIGKSFPGVRALQDVSVEVAAGEVHAILGENGAGKSTLCNVLSGVFDEYDGVVRVGGEPATIHSPKASQALGIAMIHQELNLVPDMSLADNVFLGREPRTRLGTIDRATMHARTREVLDRLGLELEPRRLVRNCRIAEQQLVEVAKALVSDVRILIMDEPTSALADAEVSRLFEVIRGLTDRGVAVLYISHRLEELEALADRVTVLRDGGYVGTVRMSETSRSELIRMMVGRPLGEFFDRGEAAVDESAFDGGETTERLRVEGLSTYGDREHGRTALRGVDLSVRAGEVVGLAGLMRAGRTEVLEAIYGAAGIRSGTFHLEGRRYRPRSPRHAIDNGIAFIAEDRKAQSLVLRQSVRFNTSLAALATFRRMLTVDGRRERRAVDEQVESLGIKTPSINARVQNLSGGNQQKVVLAKCLLTQPSILLMDEPTRGIDVGAKTEIYALMGELAQRGTAILMVSSELPELLAICDRIVVLCEGRVTAELLASEASQESILEAATARGSVVST